MDGATEFDIMNYSELRSKAKQFGIKANLKADKLRNELKRVSMLGVASTDDDDEILRDPEKSVPFPLNTPANVTRRKLSRALSRSSVVELHDRGDADLVSKSAKVSDDRNAALDLTCAGGGVADKTIADPLGEVYMHADVRPYLSDDEDKENANLSAFLSEGEEGMVVAEKDGILPPSLVPATTALVEDSGAPMIANDLKLERQRTFEMDSPSTDARPPLARQRTFEMESPTIDSPGSSLARRTFENESPALETLGHSPSKLRLPSVGSKANNDSMRRRTFEKQPSRAISNDNRTFQKLEKEAKFVKESEDTENGEDVVATVFGMEMPDFHESSPPTEFSILQDETSGLTEEELKARIMASIAVAPSAALAKDGVSSERRENEDGNMSKSCSKDWKKIHSTNDRGMESLVDFYQRKKKRAEEAQKSTQKSAAKVAAVAASKKGFTTGKSVRALAFAKDRPITAVTNASSKSAIPSLIKLPVKRAPQNVGKVPSTADPSPAAKRTRTESASTNMLTQSLKRRGTAMASPSYATSEAAKSLKRARTNIASPVAFKRAAPPVPNEPTSKRVKTSETRGPAPREGKGSSTKPHLFVPSVFSTKNMSLNFGAVDMKQKYPAVHPVMKGAAGANMVNASKTKTTTSVAKAKVPASVLPSLPKVGGDRRVSPRINKSVSMTIPGGSAVKSSSTTSIDTTASRKVTTPLSRLAPSRNTTPGKISAAGTPASASRVRKTPQSEQKSPWVPAGIALPKFNFAGTTDIGENVFKFSAATSTAGQLEHQLAKKKFDLKESLKQKLKYKPHRGPLQAFDEGKAKASALNKKQFRR